MELGVPYFTKNQANGGKPMVSGQVSQQWLLPFPNINHPDLGMVWKLATFFPADAFQRLQGVHRRAFISGDGTIGQTAQASWSLPKMRCSLASFYGHKWRYFPQHSHEFSAQTCRQLDVELNFFGWWNCRTPHFPGFTCIQFNDII